MKILFYTLLLLILLFVIFIVWAKSEFLSAREFPKEKLLFYKEFREAEKKVSNSSLKVVTWNMGYASGELNNKGKVLTKEAMQNNLQEMIAQLKTLDADLIFLQEVDFRANRTFNVNQLEFLQKELKMPYAAYTVLWNKRYVPYPYWPISKHFGHVISGQAVLSRLPIVSKKVLVLPKPPHAFWYNWFYLDRIHQQVDATWNQKALSLWNVHHEAFHAFTRRKQVESLVKEIQENIWDFKIVAGDFNDPTTDNEHRLIDKVYMDTFDLFEKKSDLISDRQAFPEEVKTFASFALRDKLDHILISKALTFKERKVICAKASDHCLVFAEIAKKE